MSCGRWTSWISNAFTRERFAPMPDGDGLDLKTEPELVFFDGTDEPGTHVLIVGIGHYPCLLGGEKENSSLAEGMGQLDAPPISARKLAQWFLEDFHNPEKPLRSIAMVVSEREPSTFQHARALPPHPLPRGDGAEVEDVIQRWIARSSGKSDNLTVFFFCGHGISSAQSVLLLRDYGAKPFHRFDGALNLSAFRVGMQTMTPNEQLFIIDACRMPSAALDKVRGEVRPGRTAISPADLDDRGGQPARQSVHHATSDLAPAYGRVDGPSLYTEALLMGLNGGGVQPNFDPSNLWVGTNALQTAVSAYVARLAAKEKVEQLPDVSGAISFKIHQPLEVAIPLHVISHPPEAMKQARVEARLDKDVKSYYDFREHEAAEEWVVNLSYCAHTIFASFHENLGFEDERLVNTPMPPESYCRINCRSRLQQ